MRAARLHDYGAPFVLEDVHAPHPERGQVVVRVQGAGIGHSDLHLMSGEAALRPRLPLILGHENAGVVAAVGAGVVSVREGDPVAIYGAWGCGACNECVTGHHQLCARPEWAGLSSRDGGYAEYILVPHDAYLVKLEHLSPREAAPLTDAALTPYRAIKKALPCLEPGHTALVIGAGGRGQYGIEILRALAGGPIIAVDTAEAKRTAARERGATHVLDGASPDVADRIMDLTGGRGVAASFDFVGSDKTLALAIGATRALGKVSQVGITGRPAKLHALETARPEVQLEVTLWGTVRELREVIALVESGRLPTIPTEHAPLEAINDVVARLARGEIAGRAVLNPDL